MKYVNGFTIPPSARLFSPERLFFPCDFYLVLSEDDVPVELNGSTLYLKASMCTLTDGYFRSHCTGRICLPQHLAPPLGRLRIPRQRATRLGDVVIT